MKAADYQTKINFLEAQLVQRDQEIAKLNAAIAGHEIHILRLKNLAINRGDKLRALEKKTDETTTKKNIWGADMDALKAECIRRTAAGEAVCVSGGKVILRSELYTKKAA